MAPFNGSDYAPERDNPRLLRQHERVRDLMLDGRWRSLAEVGAVTGDPTPSVSAQLRHLRKARFGGYKVEKRHVACGLYEYRLEPAER